MNGFEVTKVDVYPIKNSANGSTLKANCRVTYNDCFTLCAKVIDGRNGLFVGAEGKQSDKVDENGKKIFYPSWLFTRNEAGDNMRKELQRVVLKAYNEAAGTNTNTDSHHPQAAVKTRDDIPF